MTNTTSTTDLAALIRTAVREAIPQLRDELVAAVRASLADRMLSIDDAAQFVGVTPTAFRKQVERGHVPVLRIGGRVFVRQGDLVPPDAVRGRRRPG